MNCIVQMESAVRYASGYFDGKSLVGRERGLTFVYTPESVESNDGTRAICQKAR